MIRNLIRRWDALAGVTRRKATTSTAPVLIGAPFAQQKDGVAYKASEITLFEKYVRIVVHAIADGGIRNAVLAMPEMVMVVPSTQPSPFAGATAYVFDGLLNKLSIDTGENWHITFTTNAGNRVSLNYQELIATEPFYNPAVIKLWQDVLTSPIGGVFLEIGGRGDTSVALRKRLPPQWRYKSIDIHPDPQVDIVADAHRLSDVIAPGSADIYYSASTYEHLSQPWLAAIEANRVLKIGGHVFIDAPQRFRFTPSRGISGAIRATPSNIFLEYPTVFASSV